MATEYETRKKSRTTGKAVTISARISQEDAQFLAKYKVEGALTPSDKLRAMITETRERQQNMKDYRGSIEMFKAMLAPVDAQIRELELQHHTHSEVIPRVFEWLPDMMAFIMASEAGLSRQSDKSKLEEIEDGIADRVFRLIESIMQMGVTQRCPCYKTDAIAVRVGPILDLARVIGK